MIEREKEFVTFQHVSKVYNTGTIALDDLNLRIKEGEFISFLGPSGCGKSTALRMVAGLINSTEGSVEVSSRTPQEMMKETNDIAFVFQDSNLLPWRTVLDNVLLPIELRGKKTKDQIEQATVVLEKIGLGDYLHAFPRQLSGGMKMRVSIARAIVAKPKLLLMDEPFAALDEITRQALQLELLNIWEKEKMTVLFVTHNVYEAVFLSTKIAVMSARPGRLYTEIDVNLPFPRTLNMRTEAPFTRILDIASRSLENVQMSNHLV